MKSKRLDKSAGGTTQFQAQLYPHQKPVANFLRENDISIILADAGSGKDWVQLYRALEGINKGEFERLVVTKPVVEIGAGIGFLPGLLAEKTQPYERSFYHNLEKIVGKENVGHYKSKITFEHVGFVRGNTFPEHSVIILSEVQNLTLHEIISYVTRLPQSSKLFINGDEDQADIKNSGLKAFLKIVENIDGIELMRLGEEHQTRHKLITDLMKSYRNYRDGQK